MVIVKYFALEKPEKAWFTRKNIEKGSKIYIARLLITVFVFIQLLNNRIQLLFSFRS